MLAVQKRLPGLNKLPAGWGWVQSDVLLWTSGAANFSKEAVVAIFRAKFQVQTVTEYVDIDNCVTDIIGRKGVIFTFLRNCQVIRLDLVWVSVTVYARIASLILDPLYWTYVPRHVFARHVARLQCHTMGLFLMGENILPLFLQCVDHGITSKNLLVRRRDLTWVMNRLIPPGIMLYQSMRHFQVFNLKVICYISNDAGSGFFG